jgi:hypothetical protein
MNNHIRFYQYERALDPFVNAAQSTALTSACDVLYMHGSDLTWPNQIHFQSEVAHCQMCTDFRASEM